jgi:uncharacterized protein YhbP (UPF0306 family)
MSALRPLAQAVPSVLKLGATLSTLTLATVTADGLPQAAPLFFAAADDGSLIFVSGADSRHSRNIAADDKAAVTIHSDTWHWNEIVGIQMEGSVSVIPAGPERDVAWETYRTKFPFVVRLEEIVSASHFYRFTPRWVRLIDNRVHLGYKEEFRA